MRLLAAVFLLAASAAYAQTASQPAVQTAGALVVMPAFGEVRHANDEARATLMIEEQDKDKSAAASRVNQKMRQGTEILRKEDPQAVLRTRGYYTYPVYSDQPVQPRQGAAGRQPVGWRVGQYLEMTTTNLDALPRAVAAAQSVLALNSLHFGLSDATNRKLEEQRIAAAYGNLNERIAAIAKAMGRSPADAAIEAIDFEASGAYAPEALSSAKAMRGATAMAAPQVEEPSFEPGETTLGMRVVGKVRFR